MVEKNDPNSPGNKGTEENKGTSQEEPKWKQAGFESEDALIQTAKEATELKDKIKDAEAKLEKERTSRTKTDTSFMKQSQELGDLRKKLKDLETNKTDKGASTNQGSEQKELTDEEIVNNLSEEEVKKYDAILDKPENKELKKAVVDGGVKGMAEFVKKLKEVAPADLTVSVFASLKKNKGEMIPKSGIANMVKSLFETNEQNEKNKLPATGNSGGVNEQETKTKQVSKIGTVGVDFFRKDKNV